MFGEHIFMVASMAEPELTQAGDHSEAVVHARTPGGHQRHYSFVVD